MSASTSGAMRTTRLTDAQVAQLRVHTLDGCAPAFAAAVRAVVADLEAQGFDPVVFETLRCEALQAEYFARGTSNAPHADTSWHFFGLAADVISRAQAWDAPNAFWVALGTTAERHGLAWGGRWPHRVDRPHVQWGRCRISPSDTARALVAAGGLPAVWAAVGAA